uniref:Uncharacterized protein n=1 Tax=Cryptomonas curvata TaxID=233186 RepID=A0A7S0MBQ0_9CRYP
MSFLSWLVGVVSTTAGTLKIFKKFKWIYRLALPDVWRLDFRKHPPAPLPLHFVDLGMYKLISQRLARGAAGVFVHWGIPHGGKSVCGLAVAHEIWKQNRGVLHIDCHMVPLGDDVDKWFRKALKIPSACDDVPLIEYLAPGGPTSFDLESADPIDATIILDHFDHVMQIRNWESCLKSWAHLAYGSRRFNVMLCVTSEMHASQIILLNGGRKFKYLGLDIPNYGKWLEPDITALVGKLSDQDAHGAPKIEDGDRVRLITYGVLSGSPYPIIEAWDRGFDNIDWTRIENMAKMASDDWRAAAQIRAAEDVAAERRT